MTCGMSAFVLSLSFPQTNTEQFVIITYVFHNTPFQKNNNAAGKTTLFVNLLCCFSSKVIIPTALARNSKLYSSWGFF